MGLRYNASISIRLLGHYRLFQNFKKGYSELHKSLPAIHAYILQYRMMHGPKYFFTRLLAFFFSTGTYRSNYLFVEVEGINRLLVNESSGILVEFLANADGDFEKALTTAIQKINEPSFIHRTDNKAPAPIQTGAQGKEKGIFSKHQVLLLLDQLSSTPLEKIKFGQPSYRMESLAGFLHALTGHSKSSWLKELSAYKNNDLYEHHTPEQANNLINTLRNLIETCDRAGLRSIGEQANLKIRDLEQPPLKPPGKPLPGTR